MRRRSLLTHAGRVNDSGQITYERQDSGRRWAPTASISGLRGWTQAELGGLEVDESTGLAIAAPPPWPLLLVLEFQQPDVVVEREALGRAPQDRANLAQGQAQPPPCV